MKKTKVSYPKQAKEILHQKKAPKSVQTKSFESVDLFEENQNIKQQLDELESQKDLGQLGGQVDTSGLQSKLTAGTNISISDQNVISATNTTYTAGTNVSINANNVISATDTTYTAGTNVTIDQNNVISASCVMAGEEDLAEVHEQINKIKKQLTILSGGVDNDRLTGTCPLFGEHEIVQTYDMYEREIQLQKNDYHDLLLPNIFCSTETEVVTLDENQNEITQTATANISFEIKFTPSAVAGVATIKLYDNTSIIDAFSASYTQSDLGTEQTFTAQISNYSCTTRNHNFYINILTSLNDTVLDVSYIKFEITAPNASILNKIDPFDVTYNKVLDKYFITNCTSGTAKICEISPDDLNYTSDIVWTDTGVEAQNFSIVYISKKENNVYSPDEKMAIITHKNCTVEIKNLETNASFVTEKYYSLANNCITKLSNLWVMLTYAKGRDVTDYRYTMNKNAERTAYCSINGPIHTQTAGVKCNNNFYEHRSVFEFCLYSKQDGSLVFSPISYTGTQVFEKNASSPKIYIDNMPGNYNVYYSIYFKYLDRFVKMPMHYTYQEITCSNLQNIGRYQSYFPGANNDYFCVKNNQLFYYKTENQPQS